jgi:hypothetical protein
MAAGLPSCGPMKRMTLFKLMLAPSGGYCTESSWPFTAVLPASEKAMVRLGLVAQASSI